MVTGPVNTLNDSLDQVPPASSSYPQSPEGQLLFMNAAAVTFGAPAACWIQICKKNIQNPLNCNKNTVFLFTVWNEKQTNSESPSSSRGGRSSQTHRLCSEGHILTQSHEHTEHVQPRPQSNDLTVPHRLDLSSAYWSVCWSISELCMLQDGWRRTQRSTCY